MERKNSFLKGALTGALVASIIFVVCISIFINNNNSNGGNGLSANADDVLTLDTKLKLYTINQLIDQAYLYSDKMDAEELQKWLIKGYVEGLGDPYSVYYDETETQNLLESSSGEFGGIGVSISQNVETKIITFVTVYEGSPADKAGFKDGDIVYKVDGEDVTGQDLDTVVSKIRGEKGTEVELTVYRGNNLEEHTYTAVRDIIESQTVEYEMKEDNIGYIQVSGFEGVTYRQFEAAINDLNQQGMQKLIVDLRNNPGGNYDTVCDMLDLILPEGMIVYTKDKQGTQEVVNSDDEKKLEIPLAVLINGNSASASEIFAGAIKDHKVGQLVGTKTYGKGIVQQIFSLQDGTSLKLTISEYFTPSGKNIHGIGIEPDIEVEYEYDEKNPTRDNQLEKAIEILKNK